MVHRNHVYVNIYIYILVVVCSAMVHPCSLNCPASGADLPKPIKEKFDALKALEKQKGDLFTHGWGWNKTMHMLVKHRKFTMYMYFGIVIYHNMCIYIYIYGIMFLAHLAAVLTLKNDTAKRLFHGLILA